MARKPCYIVFAGVNGAGKSTLFRSGMWEHGPIDGSLPRINSDEILVAQGWDWADEQAQLQAGRIALEAIREHFAKGESFNQETTLSGRLAIRNLRKAQELGYYTILFYVGVETPGIAQERIAHRVSIGGHDVDAATVARRYDTSVGNLLQALTFCDESYLYDNTRLLKLVARFERDELAYIRTDDLGVTWHRRIIERFGYRDIAFPAHANGLSK